MTTCTARGDQDYLGPRKERPGLSDSHNAKLGVSSVRPLDRQPIIDATTRHEQLQQSQPSKTVRLLCKVMVSLKKLKEATNELPLHDLPPPAVQGVPFSLDAQRLRDHELLRGLCRTASMLLALMTVLGKIDGVWWLVPSICDRQYDYHIGSSPGGVP